IWNLVFMQYEQVTPDERIDLPKPSIDTGMGLERLAALMQGKHDNYDTDLMQALIHASADASNQATDGEHAVSHRVIADHLRATSFLIADGVLPSNEGRGYVLRRIMRRAMRHAHLMGCQDPLMWQLVPSLVREMGQAFPELGRAEALVTETLKLEENRFKQTLDRGLRLLDDEVTRLGDGEALPGEVAFKLYDTYGFPLDLTEDALRNQGRTVETEGFKAAMERQRADARKAWSGSGDAATETLWFEMREDIGASEFLGYKTEVAEGVIEALVVDGENVTEASGGTDLQVVVNQTPFYAESGGQVGDAGVMFTPDGVEVTVGDTLKKLGNMHVHGGAVKSGSLKVGDVVEMRVDGERRDRIRANHSVTHLLHEALRRQLGDHVTQKGSLVSADRLRFDISHPKPVSAEEIAAAEAEVNARIRENSSVGTVLMSPEEAVEAGAMALFGEKYGDEVRVVSMGGDDDARFSVELCGGTHVNRTGDIGYFKIVSESAVAAGVRRIEALTGAAAIENANSYERMMRETAATLKAAPAEVAARVAALSEERKKLEKELIDVRRQMAMGGGGGAQGPQIKDINGVAFAGRVLEGVPAKDLKGMIDELKGQQSGVYVMVSVNDGKAAIVVGVNEDLLERFSAVDLVKIGVEKLGGKGGGGRPDMAQGGGPDGSAADDAVAAIEAALA
ncbi:MAG: alanine--tRNA ligase, partial [Alphaproteobacteria bacterium]|nr:alanine--tRNA ligase [Alphaproteobacteria bacterium]